MALYVHSFLLPNHLGDRKRDKIRKLLCDGLALVPDSERRGQDPGEIAAAVESAIYNKYGGNTGPEYSSKVRTLSFNLKDPSNPDLRARVLNGAIDPQVRDMRICCLLLLPNRPSGQTLRWLR